METAFVILSLFFVGTVFGSFAGAQVWRLRARQLVEDKAEGIPVDKAELKRLKPLREGTLSKDHSRCLSCGHRLRWFDLIPLLSWLSTGRKCRYCRVPIGWFEPACEIGMAVLFVGSFLFWPWGHVIAPGQWGMFIVWLASIVCLVIMIAYDGKWKLLPDITNYLYIVLGIAFVVLRVVVYHDVDAWSVVGAVAILSGLYLMLYSISKGAWIGLGDIKLGFGLALFLADWKLAFLALFLANLIGCLLVLPGLMQRRLKGQSQIAFGPLLIIGMLISFFWGQRLIEWFMHLQIF